MRAPIGVGLVKSNGVPLTGSILPVGISVVVPGVYLSAAIIISWPRMVPESWPARLK